MLTYFSSSCPLSHLLNAFPSIATSSISFPTSSASDSSSWDLPYRSAPLAQLVHARARRRFHRGLKRRPMGLIKKLRKSKKEAAPNEKPAMVKTHLRDMIIVPEMIGSVVGVYVSANLRLWTRCALVGCFGWPKSRSLHHSNLAMVWFQDGRADLCDRTANPSPLSRSSLR